MRRQALIVVLAVLALRLPFLDTAAQWDDFNYLAAGEYARENPAHPSWMRFVFRGEEVDMRGHPHPPGMAWVLAAVGLALGPFREAPYHAAFLTFSLMAALSMLALARRFAPARALEATLLFLVVPASMVSGTSFESDLPLLALWTLSLALFFEAVERRSGWLLSASALAMSAAAMVAYSAFLLAPIGALYLRDRRERWRAAWLALVAPLAAIGLYQLYERMTGGALPAGELLGHLDAQGLQRLEMKARNAVALMGHMGLAVAPLVWLALARRWLWLAGAAAALAAGIHDPHPLFWAPIGFGVVALGWTASRLRDGGDRFLAAWAVFYFAAALAIFFAGAARYLLPLAAPLALLVARALEQRAWLLRGAIALNLALGLGASWSNAEHWNQNRDFAREAMARAGGGRVWVNAEWGLRHYAESAGARPLLRGTVLQPGDWLMESELSGALLYGPGGNELVTRLERDVAPRVPLRVAGLDARASYATAGFGLRAFGWSHGAADRLTLREVVAAEPSLEWLAMNAPEAGRHFINGVYALEGGEWRWAAPRSAYRLKAPRGDAVVAAEVYLPPQAPGRLVLLMLDGRTVAEQVLPGEGRHRIESAALQLAGGAATIELAIDRGFRPAGDNRDLGLIVVGLGFQTQP